MSERVPEGWTKTQLHELLTVPRKEKETKTETIELLTVKLHGQGIVRSGKFPKPTPNGRPYFKRLTGELLIGRQNLHNGGLGLVTKETSGLIASNAISSFVNRASSDLNFIHQLLSTEGFQKQIDTLISGTGQKETSEKQILSCGVVVPPLPEQKKIASILSSVDEVIENTQKQIDKLQDLKKATMNELLTKGIGHTEFKDSELGRIPKGWEMKRLGDVSKIYFSNVDKKNYINEIPVFLCNYMDVYNNSCIKNGIEFMRATAKQREIDKFLLLKDDVIITKDSETPDDIAVSAYVSEHLKNVLCGYHLALIRSDKKKLSGAYLAHLFELDDIQHRYYQLANGSTRFGLTSDAVLESSIPVPPLREQKKIASILTSMDTQIQKRERKLEQTQFLKKSLMQDLLTGKVRVQVN